MTTLEPTNDELAYIAGLISPHRDYRRYLEELIKPYKYVVFYGGGAVFKNVVVDWNETFAHKLDFVCDRDGLSKWPERFDPHSGAKVLLPDELAGIKDECIIFMTMGDCSSTLDGLRASGFKVIPAFYKYDLHYSLNNADPDLVHICTQLANARSILADEQSRGVFDVIARRAFRGLDDLESMRTFAEPNQYFIEDIVALSQHEHFVDVGAFTGDTLADFLPRVSGRFSSYHGFELSKSNFAELRRYVEGLDAKDRISIHELGLGDRAETVRYGGNESDSKVGGGDTQGRIDTMDNMLNGREVTFIKMDIEGYELRALRGAENIIKTQKPTVAACIYHEANHLWEIPLYLKSLVPEYTIYLRHHTNLEYETVCYAVYEK